MKHIDSYHVGHPNPQLFRDDYVNLDGEWNFCFDEKAEGVEQKYFLEFPKNSLKIIVPFAYQSKASGINMPDYISDNIWYQKDIQIDDLSKNYLLHFLGIDYESEIYLNGKLLAHHLGAYDSFDIYLPKNKLKLGANNLVIHVIDRCDADQIRGKQAWRKDNFTCFYTRTSGIIKSVYIEKINDEYIKYFSIKGDFLNKNIKLCVELNCTKKLTLRFSYDDKTFEFPITKKGEFNIDVDEAIAWSTSNPYLYNCTFELIDGNNIVDKIQSYFGFKSLYCKDGHIFINGEDTYLKLILNQGYWPDKLTSLQEKEIIEDLTLTKQSGFNGFRMHQYVPEPLLFYYADLMGLLVWQEVPSPACYTFNTMRNCFREIPNQIKDHLSHPCIMAYTIFNESWGINEIKESKEIQKFTVDMINMLRPLVNDCLLISNDGWYHTTSDLITIHNYCSSYKDLDADLPLDYKDKLLNGENPETIKNFVKTFAGEYRYQGQPIILSEFFGVSFEKDNTKNNWGYGNGVKDEDEYLSILKDQLNYVKTHKYYRGFCITQLSDVQQEVNGIVTFERKKKCDINKIQAMMGEFK